MSRRRKGVITVDDRSEADLDAEWNRLGRRLRALLPTKFDQILALVDGYVRNEDRERESPAEFEARLTRIHDRPEPN